MITNKSWDDLILIATATIHPTKKSAKERLCDYIVKAQSIDELIKMLPTKAQSRQVSLSLQLDRPVFELLATAVNMGIMGNMEGAGSSHLISKIIVDYFRLLNKNHSLPEITNVIDSDRSIIPQSSTVVSEERLLDTMVPIRNGGNSSENELNPIGSGISLS